MPFLENADVMYLLLSLIQITPKSLKDLMMKMLLITLLPVQMTLDRRHKLLCRFTFFLCACVLTVVNMTPGTSWVYAAGGQPRTYSLEAKGTPLGEIIQKLSEISGYEISLDPDWEAMLVSISMRNVTLYEGLNLLLSRLNSAIVIDPGEKKCSITIFDSIGDQQSATFGLLGVESNTPTKKGPIQKSLPSEDTTEQLDLEVLPPLSSGEKGINLRELVELEKDQNQLDDENREILPPDKSGYRGITVRDLAELEMHQNQIDSINMEVLPPKKPGEKGLTLWQLKTIKNNQLQISTENLVAHPPIIPQKMQ